MNWGLEQDRHPAAEGFLIKRTQIHAIEENPPLIGIVEATHKLDEGTLACSVVANQGNYLAFGYLEVEFVKYPIRSSRVGKADALETNRVLHRKPQLPGLT